MKYNMIGFITTGMLLFFLTSCSEKIPLSPNTQKIGSVEYQQPLKEGNSRAQVDVMTWNVYVGANVDIVLGATDLFDLSQKVAAAYDTLILTNFPERAQTIAGYIARKKPHLIGLQEISLIQRFSDLPPGGILIEQFDYLQILLDALSARGLNYEVANFVNNIDIVVPRFVVGPSDPGLDYVRLRDSDVILARKDVDISNPAADNYNAKLSIDIEGLPPIEIPRGYVAVNAKVGQKTYRFVNTHLEAFSESIRRPQAQELITTLASETLPIILVGDFNTPAPTPVNPNGGLTYQDFVDPDAGYMDVWPHNLVGNEGDGFTAPHDSDLRNEDIHLNRRIDLIFVRNQGDPSGQNEIGPVQAIVLGDEFNERTPSGLWPSDHAGIIAKLHVAQSELISMSTVTALDKSTANK
jgi:hypothetical protein